MDDRIRWEKIPSPTIDNNSQMDLPKLWIADPVPRQRGNNHDHFKQKQHRLACNKNAYLMDTTYPRDFKKFQRNNMVYTKCER